MNNNLHMSWPYVGNLEAAHGPFESNWERERLIPGELSSRSTAKKISSTK